MKANNSLLNNINSPADLKKLDLNQQLFLCAEIRNEIIQILANNPGHFGASLGAVELAVAIHSVFDTPNDKLIWDVGHQAYAHKIITGRRAEFKTLRKKNGISGFPKITESVYDTFGTGHSSTSISAILGMAVADKLNNGNRQHVAVIGDGALTGGMSFEALNHAHELHADVLIIINDNNMSIDPNIGGLQAHLNNINPETNLFTNLNIAYHGPIDGNDLPLLSLTLEEQKEKKGIRILHVRTVKGKGYLPSETGDQTTWHAPGCFNAETGKLLQPNESYPKKYQEIFGKHLLELARKNKDIVVVTPAMGSGSSLLNFKKEFPDRYFDVGIAEQHALTFSAGLAAAGKIPFCVIYSTFLQRGYDQLIHDIALQNLKVIICIDRAGLVGADGGTHHGIFDIAYLNAIPNLQVSSPINELELTGMMNWACRQQGPLAIRYPRGEGVMKHDVFQTPFKYEHQPQCLQDGDALALISFGPLGNEVQKAVAYLALEDIYIGHFDLKSAKPLPHDFLKKVAQEYSTIITIEDGVISGGVGACISQFYSSSELRPKVINWGIKNHFPEHGTTAQLYFDEGLTAVQMVNTIKQILSKSTVTF